MGYYTISQKLQNETRDARKKRKNGSFRNQYVSLSHNWYEFMSRYPFLLCLKMSEKEKPNENDRDHKDGDKRDRDQKNGTNDSGGPEKRSLAKLLCVEGFPKKNIPDDFKSRISNKEDLTERFYQYEPPGDHNRVKRRQEEQTRYSPVRVQDLPVLRRFVGIAEFVAAVRCGYVRDSEQEDQQGDGA